MRLEDYPHSRCCGKNFLASIRFEMSQLQQNAEGNRHCGLSTSPCRLVISINQRQSEVVYRLYSKRAIKIRIALFNSCSCQLTQHGFDRRQVDRAFQPLSREQAISLQPDFVITAEALNPQIDCAGVKTRLKVSSFGCGCCLGSSDAPPVAV